LLLTGATDLLIRMSTGRAVWPARFICAHCGLASISMGIREEAVWVDPLNRLTA
jgi:hypothetical protein